ncbi:hypothetical protein ACLBWP_03280 [Microbacterium sp. M1A1_1b]
MAGQRYTVVLADTADPTGATTKTVLIDVPTEATAQDAALDAALEHGATDGVHYLVVGIDRGSDR